MRTALRKLLRDGRGATAVEYGLILALVVLAMLGGLVVVGGGVTDLWGDVANDVNDAIGG